MEELGALRAAISSLYTSTDGGQRQAADSWLRSFAGQAGAWRLLVALLSDGAVAADHERFFAATTLRHCCQQKEVTETSAASTLVQLLAQQFAAAAAAGHWHTANQLAAALVTVAVRTPTWPVEQLLPQLLPLVQGALQAAASSDINGVGIAAEQAQLALLRVLSSLAEAANSRDLSMHPQRREDIKATLAAASEPLAAVQASIAPGTTLPVQAASLQLVQAWCGLGVPPAGSEASTDLWQQLHQAALQPELGGAAAEALAALYASCVEEAVDAGAPGGGGGSSSGWASQHKGRRSQVVQRLLGLLPGFAGGLQQVLGHAHGEQQAQLLFAALTIVGAAARAADSLAGAVSGAVSSSVASEAVQLAAEVALAALQHPHQNFDVTLAALQYWDDQLDRWQQQAAPQQQQQLQPPGAATPSTPACTPQQQQALLGRLCGVLLQRLTLPADLPASATTADARDLPDDIQLVRREVADTFRAAADCLGPQATRRQLLLLAGEARSAWQQAGDSARGWQQFECCLYALNLVWARQRSQHGQQEASAEVAQAAAAVAAALHPAAPKLSGTALTILGGMADQLPLLMSPKHRSSHEQQQGGLPHLLAQLLELVQQTGDERLSRNAATTCYRLTGSRQLAALLAAHHPDWANALCRCYAAAGGMTQRAQSGEDLSTAQFLLVAICNLAAAAAAVADEASSQQATGSTSQGAAVHSAQPVGGVQLLQQLLSQPAAAAQAALAAAAAAGTAAGNAAGAEQYDAQLEQAALHIETIAVALEAVAPLHASSPANSGSTAKQLPAMLNSLTGVLEAAAAAACVALHSQQQQHAHPQLLQAVCRVAAAAAGSAADCGLHLLQPFISNPPHPCVLLSLAALAAASGATPANGSSISSMQHLQAAASTSMQAAAAQHSSDPDWQPALLALGSALLAHMPAAAAAGGATLEAMLSTAQHSMQSYHRDVCEKVLSFVEQLLCIGCTQQHPATSSLPGTLGQPASAPTAPTMAAWVQLQQRLDSGGLGAALLLGLLLAASGSMPPYMMVHIADSLHQTWRAVGTDRLAAWLRDAALQRAPEGAPWRRWKQEAQVAGVADLLSPLCMQDARRFKRLLKVFCGGKKKGQHMDQPARASAA